ncbi:NUDIX domain-containing protein [Haloparvum sp. PAK95]|uniref:NUDIX domain-containing protein n=1 Tax=Haloparvum sp. PAK95 TaxID=3418962 RepID=UPI003D2EF43C
MTGIEELREQYSDVPVTESVKELSPAAFQQALTRAEQETAASVGSVVRDEAERVLLVSNAWSDGWIVPGGLAKPGESLATAAEREVREETGVDATIERPVEFRRQRLQRADGSDEVTMWFVGFLARTGGDAPAVATDPGTSDESIERVDWFEAVPNDCADRTLLELAGVLG